MGVGSATSDVLSTHKDEGIIVVGDKREEVLDSLDRDLTLIEFHDDPNKLVLTRRLDANEANNVHPVIQAIISAAREDASIQVYVIINRDKTLRAELTHPDFYKDIPKDEDKR